MKKNKQNYVAPGLTVVEFRVEKGYALSIQSPVQMINTAVEQQMFMAQIQDDGTNLVASTLNQGIEDNSTPTGGWQYENGGWF